MSEIFPPGSALRSARFDRDADSDPEEADLQEHLNRVPSGFYARRVVRSGSEPRERRNEGAPRPTDPSDGSAILDRFTDMLMHDFQAGSSGRSGPERLFPDPQATFFSVPPRLQRTVIRGPDINGSQTTFTIATGTFPGPASGEHRIPPDFNTYVMIFQFSFSIPPSIPPIHPPC